MKNIPPVEIVSLYRAGSGGFLVNGILSPKNKNQFEGWIAQMVMCARANYGKIQLVVTAPTISGYDGHPGCSITFLPGNKDGVIENVTNCGDVKARDPLPNKIEGPVNSMHFPGYLTLEFGFQDLENLHAALGKIIKHNKEEKEKSSNKEKKDNA